MSADQVRFTGAEDGYVHSSENMAIGVTRAMTALAVIAVVTALLTVPQSTANFTAVTDNTGNLMVADTRDPPTGLAAVGGPTVSLSWTPTPDAYADGHRVYRSETPGGPYTEIASVTPRTTTTYVDSPAAGDYYYVLRAFEGAWVSVESTEAAATVLSTLTQAPSNARST